MREGSVGIANMQFRWYLYEYLWGTYPLLPGAKWTWIDFNSPQATFSIAA